MMGVTDEFLQRERERILDATPESIRELAAYIDAFMEEDCLCVVGNAQRVRTDEKMFDRIENLF